MKQNIIRENTRFRTLYYRGKSAAHPLLIVFCMKNRLACTRTGITTGKKVGKAVLRSRSRRVIRAAYRELAPLVRPGFDLIFVARSKTPFAKTSEVKQAMESLLTELGVMNE
jgi:ribonuclease P protein component